MLTGMAAALASALAWAVGAILFRRVGERASPSAMNLLKSLMGLLLLGAAVWVDGVVRMEADAFWRLVGSGVLGIAIGDTLFFAALVRLEPRLTLLLATVGHVFAVVLSMVWLHERPGAVVMAGMALVLGGVGWVLQVGAEPGQPTRERGWGILYGLGSALATSSGLILAKTGVDGVPTLEATWLRLAAGVLVVAGVRAVQGGLIDDLNAVRLPGLVRELLLAVTVVMFGGFWLSLWSIKYADASVATALASTEPVFVLLLSRFWLGETVSRRAVMGAVVAVVGVGMIVGGH